VVISDGPFAKFVGTLEQLDAAGRVLVLLDLLGRSVRVSVKTDGVGPIC
jgi:transcription antitermination factor NusG